MGGILKAALAAAAATALLVTAASASACSYKLEGTTRVTYALGESRTTRSNGQCIAVDPQGRAHLTWEDDRHSNREVYYGMVVDGQVVQEIRITRTPGESSYPCIAADSENVYILWEEVIGQYSDIMYARIRDGEVVARKRLTRTYLDSSCPVSALGPDGSLHIAWHEGPFMQTAIYYGRVRADSLIERFGVCTTHPKAFRPEIGCNQRGEVMVIWPEGDRMSSRLYDGSEWAEEKPIADLALIPWRVSVAGFPDGRWAAAWFDDDGHGNEVLAAFYEDGEWQDPTWLSGEERTTTYYPDLTVSDSGELIVVYECRSPRDDFYAIRTRCHDGAGWGPVEEFYRENAAGRYVSLAYHDGVVHAVWFSAKEYDDEIYYSTLRSER